MTGTSRSGSPISHLQASAAFWPVVATTGAVALASVLAPWPNGLSITVVVVVVAVLGIPHGAVDHLVVDAIEDRNDGRLRLRFIAMYVLALVGVGLVWLAVPSLALAAFLVLSVHHFGRSDLAHLALGEPHQRMLEWSRGLFLVGVPIVAHLAAVAPVVERLGGGDPSGWPWLGEFWWLWCGLLVVQHVVIGTFVARTTDRTALRHETVTVVALTALFLTADPLVGFAVYFGLWHSLAHLLVLAELLGSEPSPLRSIFRLGAPSTAVSLVALSAALGGAALADRSDLVVPAVFVAVSMLTVPHMVVVERLWRRRPCRTNSLSARQRTSR